MVTTRYSDQQGFKSRQNPRQVQATENVGNSCFLALGGLNEDKLCDTSQAMAPTNLKTVYQNSLLHIESKLDRLGLLSPTHGQSSQQPSVQITLQSVLIYKPKFLKATHHTKMSKIEIPIYDGGSLELVKPAHEPASSRLQPWASLKKPHESCTFAVPCWSS